MADEPQAGNPVNTGATQPNAAPVSPVPTAATAGATQVAATPAPKVPIQAPARLILPVVVITGSDVGRLIRELEAIDNFLSQAAIRQTGTPLVLPKVSRMFEELVSSNKLNMLHEPERQLLSRFLQQVHAQAPILHVSFCTDPSPIFQQRFITWVRQQIHPIALLQVGLYPNIGAGCVVRTTNKYFDFSLKQRFNNQKALLVEKLHGLDAAPQVDTVVEAAGPVTA